MMGLRHRLCSAIISCDATLDSPKCETRETRVAAQSLLSVDRRVMFHFAHHNPTQFAACDMAAFACATQCGKKPNPCRPYVAIEQEVKTCYICMCAVLTQRQFEIRCCSCCLLLPLLPLMPLMLASVGVCVGGCLEDLDSTFATR